MAAQAMSSPGNTRLTCLSFHICVDSERLSLRCFPQCYVHKAVEAKIVWVKVDFGKGRD